MASIEPAELGGWYDAYGAALVLYARQWLETSAAEDTVQDVFMRLMAGRNRPTSPRAWLFRAVRNAAISGFRSQKRRDAREARPRLDTPPLFEPDPDERIDAATAQELLVALPEDQREVVIMRIWGQLPLREIAETLEEPLSTVFSRYQAALTVIRQRMERSETKNRSRTPICLTMNL